jgi:hypothetical protein
VLPLLQSKANGRVRKYTQKHCEQQKKINPRFAAGFLVGTISRVHVNRMAEDLRKPCHDKGNLDLYCLANNFYQTDFYSLTHLSPAEWLCCLRGTLDVFTLRFRGLQEFNFRLSFFYAFSSTNLLSVYFAKPDKKDAK